MAFVAGLVTVTFRQLAPREVIELARETKLSALEWGGDVHVPPGDLEQAREVGRITRDAGLSVVAYGSYFRVGDDIPCDFEPVLQAAVALGAPVIRVWAGRRGSKDADAAYRARVLDDSLLLSDRAAEEGIALCYEYHADTLTDTDESAQALLRAANFKMRTLWQPPHERTVARRGESLRGVLPWLNHVHVFHWPRRGERVALEEGSGDWGAYLNVLREEGKECPMLLEFVRGDDPEQFRRDARTFRSWIGQG